MNAQSIQDIVTEGELDTVWGNANFGPHLSKRYVIEESLLKCLGGYRTGHTAQCILRDLGLVYSNKWDLTKKGREYLYLAITNRNN